MGRGKLKKTLMLFMVAMLAGCDDAPARREGAAIPDVAVSQFYKDRIYLPDGAGLQMAGKLKRYELVENDKGSFDRYTFEFSQDSMAVEGAVFASLAKSNYQRKVRREDARLFVVNYVKKGFPPVSMTYERAPENKEKTALTRLKIVWKNT